MCKAVTRVISASKLEGVQKIHNLWRLYVKEATARLKLFVNKSILINGKNITLYDQNPYVSRQELSSGRNGSIQVPQANDKITVKHLPLSVSNEEIRIMLEEKGVHLVSSIMYSQIRDSDGHLTRFKCGDRFLYVKPLNAPLPRKEKIGNFPCLIFHNGQDINCIACGERGHKVGDPTCTEKPRPSEQILAFKSYAHPLSNHFPCQLNIYEQVFRSAEHAYFWFMATDFGKPQLAEEIHKANHAGAAKRLSKNIANDETRWRWEEDNVQVMKDILCAKAKQCKEFYNCLMENKSNGILLAEATPSKFWGTGLSLYVTQNCSPGFWPGHNMLGALLMELSESLSGSDEPDETAMEEGAGEGDAVLHQSQSRDNSPEDLHRKSDDHSPEVLHLQSHDLSLLSSTATPNTTTITTSNTGTPPHTPVRPNLDRHTNKVLTRVSRATKTKIKKGNSSKQRDSKTLAKSSKDSSQTPQNQKDIRTAFLDSKRKFMDSSPDGILMSDCKSQRTDEKPG